MREKIKIAIFTVSNLKASTDSSNTVLNLLDNLNGKKYDIYLILIDDLIPANLRIDKNDAKTHPVYTPFEKLETDKRIKKIYKLDSLCLTEIKNFDFAIVAIYNSFGEDGRLIGILETLGIPYLSPNLKTSALCLDKTLTKAVLKAGGILVPQGFEIHRKNYNLQSLLDEVKKNLKYPLMIKPVCSGASWGVSLVTKAAEVQAAVNKALEFSERCLLEEYIKGEEISIGIMGDYINPKALPPVLIKTDNPFFDFEAKYKSGMAEEICPAPIEENIKKKIEATAIAAYQAVKASSHARVDMIVSDKKEVYVLEINTFPGLTSASIFPKELAACGSSLARFLDESIREKLHKV